MEKISLIILVGLIVLGGVFILKRRSFVAPEIKIQPDQAAIRASGVNLLGGQSSFCTKVPFLIEGKNIGARVAAYLGMYQDGGSPKFGLEGEAEVTVNENNEIKGKFHPKNLYKADNPDFNNEYFLYIGLIPPWRQPGGKTFEGCGYDGTAQLPTDKEHLHFAGEFKWVDGESNPPPGSGAGNILFGGWFAYNFTDGRQDIVAVDDFGTPPGTNPGSLSEAYYECGDWWHNLMWSDWWKEDGSLKDRWIPFNIDITAASQKAVQESIRPRCGSDLSDAANIQVLGLFVGPEYGVADGGASVFMLRNLRTDVY